jgi:hypothetical protein
MNRSFGIIRGERSIDKEYVQLLREWLFVKGIRDQQLRAVLSQWLRDNLIYFAFFA